MSADKPIKKVFVQTYGCQMNVYDSNKMVDVLRESHQVEQVDTAENADIILLNTCSVREKAQEKVFSDLGRWRKLKKENPELLIGVGGCVASQEGQNIIQRAPYVDMVFGPQTLHRLPDMVNSVTHHKKPVVDISFPEIEKFDNLPEPRAEGASAFVSIMEGCSKYCSFCIVPYTRGEEISRPFDDVLAEVMALVEQGVREITFLGQNVNDYRGVMHSGDIADLALLIHYTASIEEIKRIRFTTSHPKAFSDSLIEAYAQVPKLANALHLPVQSGSNRILELMKRGYTREEFIIKINKLRAVRPDIPISSDFIVGFPGETDDEFMETVDLVGEVGFDQSYSFIYSPRPGTPAAKLHDNVTLEKKKERLAILQDRLNQQAFRINQSMVGTHQIILVTGTDKKERSLMSGRTENNRIVNFPGDLSLVGQFISVEITEAHPFSLKGALVNS